MPPAPATAVPKPESAETDDRPKWLKMIGARFAESHAFLVYGNKDDYAIGDKNAMEYVCHIMSARFPNRVIYSPGSGFTFPDDESRTAFVEWLKVQGVTTDPSKVAPLPALFLIQRYLSLAAPEGQEPIRSMVIIDRIDLIAPQDRVSSSTSDGTKAMIDLLSKIGRDKVIHGSKNILIMLTPTLESAHEDLRDSSSGITPIEITLPDFEERKAYIDTRIRYREGKIHPEPVIKLDMSVDALAGATAGLSRYNIEALLIRGRREHGSVTWEVASQLSAELINAEAAGLLKVVKPEGGFNRLGGMAEFKAWAQKWVINLAKSDDPAKRAAMPMVLLFSGPPGVGKTEFAYALGQELEWNVLEYEQIRDSLVGATEKNDAKAERIIRGRLPAVVFMDEVDQMFGRVTGGNDGGGGGSVEKAIFRNRLRFLNDTSLRGQILFVLASNRPDELDGAISDRCEYRIPFLPADTVQARAEILVSQFARLNVSISVDEVLPGAEVLDDRWSGRDMKGLVTKAYGLMMLDGLKPADAIRAAALSRKPMQRADAQLMAALALDECNDIELIPPKFREKPVDRKALDREIAQVRDRLDGNDRKF